MPNRQLLAADRDVTEDSLFEGTLKCLQYSDGYRFSVDAVLVAHFCKPAQGAKVLDIGSGCGIIGMIMAYRWGGNISSLCGLEIQPDLKALAETNFLINGFSGKCTVKEGDICNALKLFEPESFTQVVCNPPFYKVSSGRQSGGEESRLARHQVSASIADFAKGSSALVKNGGTAVFIYPADQSAELFDALGANRLTLKKVRFVYSYPGEGQDARLVLAECRKNGGSGTRIMEPLYIYTHKNGSYTEEMKKLYSPDIRTG